ncbi:hypothetical protein [Novipirellula maiorica]|uniref:hypothetical protein n=1 Tax=Novipirellula maiorica TaxID=1265734 RepID=UPI0011818724|nr:hypothetical protein [Rhodopirellula maiorica]
MLIALLVACPVRCLSCDANAAGGNESAPTVCSCCSHAEDAPTSDRTNQSSDSECDCPNCICEGAVLESGVELPDTASMIVDWISVLQITVAEPSHVDTAERQSSCQYSLYGRAARIAHQSWLI